MEGIEIMRSIIKFRAWSESENKFYVFGSIFNERPYIEHSTFPQYESCKEYVNLIIEQFTGLHDRNGVDVYDGDILKDKYGQVGTCHWYYSGFEFINTSGAVDNLNDFEVIGNIHQNANLLDCKQ